MTTFGDPHSKLSLPDYAALSPEEFSDVLLGRGAVMLRNAAKQSLLDYVQQRLDLLFAEYEKMSASEFERALASNNSVERDFWRQVSLGHIFDETFKTFSGFSFFEIIRANGLWNFTSRAFPDSNPAESVVCNCRRMSTSEMTHFFDQPLDLHVDAQFFYTDRLSINFWTPLTACGKDTPGLQVVLLGVEETKKYLEYNEDGYEPRPTDINYMWKFRCDKMQLSSLCDHDLVKLVWAPEFNKGDILAFTNFTMHGTHFSPEMKKPRTSVEVRVDLHGL